VWLLVADKNWVGHLAMKVGQWVGFQSLSALKVKKLPFLEAGLRTFAVF